MGSPWPPQPCQHSAASVRHPSTKRRVWRDGAIREIEFLVAVSMAFRSNFMLVPRHSKKAILRIIGRAVHRAKFHPCDIVTHFSTFHPSMSESTSQIGLPPADGSSREELGLTVGLAYLRMSMCSPSILSRACTDAIRKAWHFLL